MPESPIICPICHVPLKANTSVCGGCDEDLAVLVYVQSQRPLLYNRGLELAKAGDFPGAILALQEAERACGESVAAGTLLGKIYAQTGRYGEARLTWARALLIEPDNTAAASGLAALHALERGRAEDVRQEVSAQGEAQWRATQDGRHWRFVWLAGAFLLGAMGVLLLQRGMASVSHHSAWQTFRHLVRPTMHYGGGNEAESFPLAKGPSCFRHFRPRRLPAPASPPSPAGGKTPWPSGT